MASVKCSSCRQVATSYTDTDGQLVFSCDEHKVAESKPVKTMMFWGWPLLSRKAHVFVDARSLCGSWLFTGYEDPIVKAPGERGPDDCAACHKKLVAHFKRDK